MELWLWSRQQGALGLTAHVREDTVKKRQTGTDTARTRTDARPTVKLRCVVFYQQTAGVEDVTAAEGDIEGLRVVKRLHGVLCLRHQAGDVDRAEAASISLRHATPCLSAQGEMERCKGHAVGQLGSCEGRRASPIISLDEEPVDLGGVLQRHFQGAVDGEEIIVDALETRVRT